MVTVEEMKAVIDNYVEAGKEKTYYSVTPEEMRRFEKNSKLPMMISQRKMKNDNEHKVKPTPGYELIEEMCCISVTSLKKTINGSDRPTRTFLYRFTVGLHMSLEEANAFFDLCGGTLREENPEDYLCIKALLDGDDIHDFCSDYEKYFNKKLTRQ